MRSIEKRAVAGILGLLCLASLGMGTPLSAQENGEPKQAVAVERTHASEASEFLVLPLRVYRLKSSDVDEANCRQLSDDDIRRIVAKANVIWASAGIHWQLESIEDLPAENTARLKLAAQIGKDDAEDAGKPARGNARLPHTSFRRIIPEASRSRPEAFRVHYVHDFDVNGVYFGNREAMVKETAALRPVEGGIDEPLPRVTSHELGHALGLPHRQDRFNLMASGTTGTTFIEAETQKAREIARSNPACRSFADLEKESSKAQDKATKASIERSIRSIRSLAGQRIHPVSSFDAGELLRIDATESAKP